MPSSQRLIALDVGEKRIGVAYADTAVRIPSPLTTVLVDGNEVKAIQDIIADQDATAIVVGYPRNQSGEPTAQTAFVEQFTQRLHKLDVTIFFQDESLTSILAEQRLRSYKKPYTKEDIDAYAATIILQDYLDNPKSAVQVVPNSSNSATDHGHHKRSGIALVFVALITAAVLAMVAAVGLFYIKLQPANPEGTPRRVQIATGSSPAQVGKKLQSEGIIKSDVAFQLYLRLKGLQSSLQAGTYALSPSLSTQEIATHIAEGKVDSMQVTIAPGQTIQDLRTTLLQYGFSQQSIEEALTAAYDHPLLASKPQGASLEGYIYPETYNIAGDAPVKDLFVRSFDQLWALIGQGDIQQQLQSKNLTVHDAVTLASIVQQEVADPAEQKQVAQVFLKRLREGIELGSDVTFIYAAELLGVEPTVGIDSPYNTRRYKGLPPGPIANFNPSALQAVAQPAEGDYLYFVAGDDGITYFSRTVEEHEENVQKHCIKLCALF